MWFCLPPPQLQHPLPSGCKVREDTDRRLPVSLVQSVFPPSQMLGLIRRLVMHSAKENCQWFIIAVGALNRFLYNLKTCNMEWPQRPFIKISSLKKKKKKDRIITQSPLLTLGFPLAVVHAMVWNKCIMTCIYYYNIKQNICIFYCHKNPLCSARWSLPPLEHVATHWSFSCFHSSEDNDAANLGISVVTNAPLR